MGAYKAKTIEDIAAVRRLSIFSLIRANTLKGAKIVTHIQHEMKLHIEYCKGFGLTKEEIEASEESQGN